MATARNRRRFTNDEVQRALDYASTRLDLSFRSQQVHALTSFIRGHDLFISLPTGFGKSVVFQAAPLCMDFLWNMEQPQPEM